MHGLLKERKWGGVTTRIKGEITETEIYEKITTTDNETGEVIESSESVTPIRRKP
jgi:hypothetical protein